MRVLFSHKSFFLAEGMAIVRIMVGAMVIYHGMEIFDHEIMNGYLQWDTFKFPAARFLVYLGKTSEFLSGILLLLGLFTRIGSVMLMGTMLFITFFIGQGRFWYEDQHPFMFAVTGLIFFFYGSGIWSLDKVIRKTKD